MRPGDADILLRCIGTDNRGAQAGDWLGEQTIRVHGCNRSQDTIAAVDKFRADRGLNYQGNPAGLVDARMIDALRMAYFEKKKNASAR